VIEDDYDSDYRFDAPPVAPLAATDPDGRVLFVGSFSKTLFPALRLGYVVARPDLLERLALLKNLDDAGSAVLEQLVLAAFIESGEYEQHLRRGNRRNAARRAALTDALAARFDTAVRVHGAQAGLHLVADFGLDGPAEARLIAALARRGVGAYGLGSFTVGASSRTGLLLGYARHEPALLRAAVAHLEAALEGVRTAGEGR
jgi:GntR family transcriptional regulator/MocR family aminotransferase